MQHESHPHDERLAALAGADREATDDRALRDHVAACDRCRAVVDDLALLRSALAELPDLRPSRPLQLLPPVAARAEPRGGLLGRLRRLSAPALAAGAGLILVGAVGSAGILQNLGSGAAGTERDSAASLSAAGERPETGEPGLYPATDGFTSGSETVPTPKSLTEAIGSGAAAPSSPEASAKESARQNDYEAQDTLRTTSDPLSGRVPWLVILGVGVVLAGGSLLLRFTVHPHAG